MTKLALPVSVAAAGLIVALAAPAAEACSDAAQDRRFVLGKADGGLVVLHLDLRRTDVFEGEAMSIRWRGDATLQLWADGEAKLLAELGAVDVAERAYSEEMRPIVRRAERAASGLRGFVAASILGYRACPAKGACGPVTLRIRGEQLAIRTREHTTPVADELADRLASRALGLAVAELDGDERAAALASIRAIHTLAVEVGETRYSSSTSAPGAIGTRSPI